MPVETPLSPTATAVVIPPPSDDSELVQACLRGEPQALARLVEHYQTDVFGTVLRLVRDRDEALELTNSIFYKVYRNLAAYDQARPFRPWLLRVASNEALNWLRARRREQEHQLGSEASEVAFESLSGGAEPEAAALAAERREAVHAALAKLPEHYRLVLTLRFFSDLSYQEIAEQTGQDANTVGVQLLRARQLLKRRLSDAAATETDPARQQGASPAGSKSDARIDNRPSGRTK